MSQVSFPIAKFQYGNTSPVANGYVLVNLNKDCRSTSGQVSAGIKSKLTLDATGAVIESPLFWPNVQLTPSDGLYIYSVYTQLGQRVLGPVSMIIGLTPNLGFGAAFGSSFAS